jgi:hypothetical protein
MKIDRRITESYLDRKIEATHDTRTLPELLLARGSMTGPYRTTRTLCSTPTRILRVWFRMVDKALNRLAAAVNQGER